MAGTVRWTSGRHQPVVGKDILPLFFLSKYLYRLSKQLHQCSRDTNESTYIGSFCHLATHAGPYHPLITSLLEHVTTIVDIISSAGSLFFERPSGQNAIHHESYCSIHLFLSK